MNQKIKIIGAFLTMFTAVQLSAQNIEIKNGDQFKVTALETVDQVIYVDDDRSTFLTKAGLLGKKFRVLSLDSKLNLKSKAEVELPKIKNKKVKYIETTYIGDKVQFLSYYFDKKKKTQHLYASDLSPKNGKFEQHLEVVTVKDDKFNRFSPFTVMRNIDSTQLLIVTRYPTKRKENVKYGLTVLNADMSELWSKDISFPEADKDFTLTDTEIDKDGNIHFIAKLRMDKADKKKSGTKARYFNKVYSFFYENEELKEYDIQFKNEIIRTLDLDVNEKNELLGVGFYAEKKLSSGYKGFFYLRIDPTTKEVVATNKTAFDKKLIEELAGKRKAKKGKFPAYTIRKSIPLDDGGFCVVAEDYQYYQNTDQNGNTTEMWNYGNVVVMFLDKDGKMTTASVIKKKQMCTAKNGNASILQQFGIGISPGVNELAYYGISVIEKDDDIFILYNENPKNEARLKDGKNPKSVRQRTSVTQMMTVKKNGEMHKSVLFKSKDKKAGVKMPLMPRSYTQYSKESTLVLGRKGKTMRATRVTID